MNKKIKTLILLITLIVSLNQYPKVLLITHSYNRPDFIEIQYKTFKKFLRDDYEYIVFNDAKTEAMAKKIDSICNQYTIPCIRIPQELHEVPYANFPGESTQTASLRHVVSIKYSLDVLGFDHLGIVGLLDSDLFLIRPFCIEDFVGANDISAFIRNMYIDFLWPGLCFLRMDRLPDKKTLNFDAGYINRMRVDSGGFTYYYLQNHSALKIKPIDILYGYKVLCPYLISPQHWSIYAPPTKASQNISNTIMHLVERDYKNRPNINAISPEKKIETLIQLGFNEKEIKFLLKNPDTIDFFLNHHFIHYQFASNYAGLTENYFQRKTQLLNEFIEDILQD